MYYRLYFHSSKLERDVVSNVCMDSIDYTVLTGIAVVAAARYSGRARRSLLDDLNNKCVCLKLAVSNALKHNTDEMVVAID